MRNRRRSRDEKEYELVDTGIFLDNRFFDMEVEYAKGGCRRPLHSTHQSQIKVMNHPNSTSYRAFGTATPGPGAIVTTTRPNLYLHWKHLGQLKPSSGLDTYELNCSETGHMAFHRK